MISLSFPPAQKYNHTRGRLPAGCSLVDYGSHRRQKSRPTGLELRADGTKGWGTISSSNQASLEGAFESNSDALLLQKVWDQYKNRTADDLLWFAV